MARQFTLGKNERLKSRKSIEQLFSEGKSFAITPFRVYYIAPLFSTYDSLFTIQFGVGVSTKNFKKAVDRNRTKRLIRETYRLQKSGLQKKLSERKMTMHVFIIYTGKELPVYQEVYNKMNLILDKLDKTIVEIK